MIIYNTLTKKKEEFNTIEPQKVRMYVCGPTVYDFFHIGNARSFIMADMIRRYLEFRNYEVKFVMNLTDVDDKIISRANENGISAKEHSETYVSEFFKDIDGLKIKRANSYPKATEYIGEMLELITNLEKKSVAYNVNGNVFYDVAKFEEYGKLSGKKTEDLEIGARVEANDEKRNPLDFALWKKAKIGEPEWESPWGKGRPGWHIECSAMSMKELGETIDIHAGGNDLIFPHHENEIAQSEASTGSKFANYWIHFGFLNIKDEKMSKSLGNFFTAREILKKYSAESIRLFLAQTHYASPLNFSTELLEANTKAAEKIKNLAIKLEEILTKNVFGNSIPITKIDEYFKQFTNAVDDDFNFPKGIGILFDFVKDVNRELQTEKIFTKEFYLTAKQFLSETAQNVLGIVDFSQMTKDNLEITRNSKENDLIKLLIDLRLEAKLNKNYALSDKIRIELTNLGINLQDTKDGTTFTIK